MNEQLELLKKHTIGILAGGSSSERDVSLKSGKAVFDSLEGTGLNVKLVDVNEESFQTEIEASGIDLAFISLHGSFGEDGTVQSMLSDMNIPYTGSGPEASALAMDKLNSKIRFSETGLNVPEYVTATAAGNVDIDRVWLPCVVKPRYEGSSFGLSVVRSKDELIIAVDKAISFGNEAIIEKFIHGREITVGVLDDSALPVVEISTKNGVYDFDAKYNSTSTKYSVPAEIDKDDYRLAQEMGSAAHRVLGCNMFSRVDMIYSGSGKIYVLEVNTIPGFTGRSLLPMAAGAEGIDLSELCVRILSGAVLRKDTENIQGAEPLRR